MNETISLTKTEIEKIIDAAVERALGKIQKGRDNEDKRRKKKYLKISEFAKEFNVGSTTVFYWILKRKIYAEQIAGTRMWRIPADEVENLKERSSKYTKKEVFVRNF
jgi:excisionase family DNA binding protein